MVKCELSGTLGHYYLMDRFLERNILHDQFFWNVTHCSLLANNSSPELGTSHRLGKACRPGLDTTSRLCHVSTPKGLAIRSRTQ